MYSYFRFKRKQCVVIEVYLDNDSETIADEIPEDETEAGGQFACKYCDKKYIRLKRLENHMANHGNSDSQCCSGWIH